MSELSLRIKTFFKRIAIFFTSRKLLLSLRESLPANLMWIFPYGQTVPSGQMPPPGWLSCSCCPTNQQAAQTKMVFLLIYSGSCPETAFPVLSQEIPPTDTHHIHSYVYNLPDENNPDCVSFPFF